MRSALLGTFVCASVFVMLAQPPSVLAAPCTCNSDVSNNGSVQAIDVFIVAECARTGTCAGCVNDCDVDCDGDVDYYDAGVAACAFDGQSNCCAEAHGACTGANNNTPACVNTTDNFCSQFSGTWHGNNSICVGNAACACNGDVNNSGSVNASDIAIVKDCISGVNCGSCVNSCDVDCDGDIDYYDVGVVACYHQGQSNCCSEPDGACTGAGDTPPCVLTTDNYCSVAGGTWHGNNSICVGAEAVEIPTVSTWGLLALGISILTAATLVIRRRALGKAVA
jgi:hypothetical protein